jgi:hypothetical protein
MSDAIYPSTLPGLKWDIVRSPVFKTGIYEALSGAERRIRHRPSPKRRIEMAYEVLREYSGNTDLKTLVGFYIARSGPWDSFLFHDPYDGQVTNQPFGVGDGVSTDFQLVRNFGSVAEVVHNPELTLFVGPVWFPTVGDDAEFWPQPDGLWPVDAIYDPAGAFTVLANGLVRFTTPPPAGKTLLWTGRFYYRARFADDTFDSTEFLKRFFSMRKVAMVMSLQNIL